MKIANKRMMYEYLNAGRFGYTWPSYEIMFDFLQATYNDNIAFFDTFVVRSKVGTNKAKFNVSYPDAWRMLTDAQPHTLNVSPSLPINGRIAHVHLFDSPTGLYMNYCYGPPPYAMNLHATGILCRELLRNWCDPIGLQTVTALLEAYPEHCIELGVFSSSIVTRGPTNTIIWEVRCLDGEYERETWGAYVVPVAR